MVHHTTNKGDLGECKCRVDLIQRGYTVLMPLTQQEPFDLVAYKDGKFIRIQVKYRSVKKGSLCIMMRSTWATKGEIHKKPVDKNEIDVFCVYCPETDECYYFKPEICDKAFTLRVERPKNNQTVGINFASDFREIPE